MEILNTVQALGIGGVFALIIIDKFVEYNRKSKSNGSSEIQITLLNISKTLDRQTVILDRMQSDCARCREEMTRLNGKMSK